MDRLATNLGYFTIGLIAVLAFASTLLAAGVYVYSATVNLFDTLRYLIGMLP